MEELLKKLKELDKKATVAPWAATDRLWSEDSGARYREITGGPTACWIAKIQEDLGGIDWISEPYRNNAALIVEMRNALPLLIETIESLKSENESLREEIAGEDS